MKKVTIFQLDSRHQNNIKDMDKVTTKYFLFFLIGFFILSFIGVAIYQNIFGNSKSYVLNKVEKRFNNNQSAWRDLFKICYQINDNNKYQEITIGYYPNLNRIESIHTSAKNNKGVIIEDWNLAYPDLYVLMKNLDISYTHINDDSFSFVLQGIPGKSCLIVYLTSSEDINDLPKNRKWQHRLKDRVYIVQMKE